MEKLRKIIAEAQGLISPLRMGVEDLLNYRNRPTVEVNDADQIVVRLFRNPETHERQYLTAKGFNFDHKSSIWWKKNDGSADEVREMFHVEQGEQTNIAEKFDLAEKMAKVQEKLKKRKSAGEVFSDFSVEAARLKVTEMYMAAESSERQRAQETVLAYALGKPIERVASMNVTIANMDDEELKIGIREAVNRIGPKIGIEGTIGRSTSILIDDRREESTDQTQELSAQSGIPDTVPQQQSQD